MMLSVTRIDRVCGWTELVMKMDLGNWALINTPDMGHRLSVGFYARNAALCNSVSACAAASATPRHGSAP